MIYKIRKSKLTGQVSLSGAKNSVLRLLAASLLTSEKVKINNYPSSLLDAQVQDEMLQNLGKKTSTSKSNDYIIIEENQKLNTELNWEKRSIRNTLLVLGALITRFGEAAVPLPGGCNLGERKYDLHVLILKKLGAEVWENENMIYAKAPKGGLVGNDISLPIRSTGATENAIICGTLAQGTTRLWNPHIRPEILDLIGFLKKMGAKIIVHGKEHVEINGVEGLSGTNHSVIPDNMEAMTWLCGAVMTGGDIEIIDFPFNDLEVVMAHLKESGAKVYRSENNLIVRGGKCYPIEISTGPHPGINSDLQPILASYAAQAYGTSKIVDLRFVGRYNYAYELEKMGLKFKIKDNILNVFGNGGKLEGKEVTALDLRAGASLLLSGLCAEGETQINDAWQIERGYDDIVNKLINMGGHIEKISMYE